MDNPTFSSDYDFSGFEALESLLGQNDDDDELTSETTQPQLYRHPRRPASQKTGQPQQLGKQLIAEEGANHLYDQKKEHTRYDVGYQLNQYDSELIRGHYLEKLKNPLHRVIAQKQRLNMELEHVEVELNRYERIKATGNTHFAQEEKIEGLKQRQFHIQHQLDKIHVKMAEHNPFFNLYQSQFQNVIHHQSVERFFKPIQKWINKIQNYLKEEKTLENLQQNFESVHEILNEHLHDPTAISPEQFTALIYQYDKDLILAERKAAKLRARTKPQN